MRTRAERRVHDLEVRIAAEHSDPYSYLITVANPGRRSFRKLRVNFRNVLLYAESFSLDTTHMPAEMQYSPGEPLLIDVLDPGQSIRVVREGYGTHERYDQFALMPVELEFEVDGGVFGVAEGRWCEAVVDLPNARSPRW